MENSRFLFGLNDTKYLVETQKVKSKTFDYEDNYSEFDSDNTSENESNSPKRNLEDYFGLDFFKSLEASNEKKKSKNDCETEDDSDPFQEIYKIETQKSKDSKGSYQPFEGILGKKKLKEPEDSYENSEVKEKIKEFLIKKIKEKYYCIFCTTKNEVNFRNGRYSECKACESRKQLYRRNLKQNSKENDDTKVILLCHSCYLENKPCDVCIKIQKHVLVKKSQKLCKEYLCLTCGTNIKERFVEGTYSRCRTCKNELSCQKYRALKDSQKLNSENGVSGSKDFVSGSGNSKDFVSGSGNSKEVFRTIPERVTKIEKTINSEIEELKLEILQLKETHHDEILELKNQIKQLRFLISRN